jgi:ribonuclease P protein component
MGAPLSHTLSKEERLCGRNAVSALLAKGRYGVAGCLKYCFLSDNGLAFSRILISVPKRSFKRAVKRNLLKRRIRESYRLQKDLFGPGKDILFIYTPKEVLPFADIYAAVGEAGKALPSDNHAK